MPSIVVTLPVSVDVSSGDVELFGQEISSSDRVVLLNTNVAALDMSGMIQYNQATNPDDVALATDVAVTGFDPASFVADLSGSLNAPVTIDTSTAASWWSNTQDSRKASAVAGNPLYNYDSLYQFLLGVVAYEVFSHPLAQAGISNDTAILASLGGAQVAQTLWNSVSALSQAQLKSVFQEIVKQDPTRFNRDDLSGNSQPISHPDDSPQYLQFQAGDVICFQVHLNTFNAVQGNNVSAPSTSGMSGSISNAGATLMSGGDDTFTVKLTLS